MGWYPDHISKHFIYHILTLNTKMDKIIIIYFFTTTKFNFYCLYEFVFIYHMDCWYHLIVSEYPSLLKLTNNSSGVIYLSWWVNFYKILKEIHLHFTQLCTYKLFFSNTQQYFFYLPPTLHNPTHHSVGGSFMFSNSYIDGAKYWSHL